MLTPFSKISFKGVYLLQGSRESNSRVYERICQENISNKIPTDFFIKHTGKEEQRVVLTDKDTLRDKSKIILPTPIRTVFSKEILDKNNEISYFDTKNGWYGFSRQENFKNTILNVYINEGKAPPFDVYKIDFKTPVSIKKALHIIQNINETKENKQNKYHVCLSEESILVLMEKAIKVDPFLQKVKILKYIDYGDNANVFEMLGGNVIKFSESPCCPAKVEVFDLPVLKQNSIKIGDKKLFYYIQPLGMQDDLTEKHQKEVEDKMIRAGYEAGDMFLEQIVLYKGKPYLCDPECARYPDNTARELI